MTGMLSSNCHFDLSKRPTSLPVQYFKTFEPDDQEEDGNRDTVIYSGSIRNTETAFCGQHSLSFEAASQISLYAIEGDAVFQTTSFGQASRFQVRDCPTRRRESTKSIRNKHLVLYLSPSL